MTSPIPPSKEEIDAVLCQLERDYRADHQYASTADHPATKRRIDRDVEAAISPVRELFASILSALSSAERERDWILGHKAVRRVRPDGIVRVIWYDAKDRRCTTFGRTLSEALRDAIEHSSIPDIESVP